jgi:hypothetical protein
VGVCDNDNTVQQIWGCIPLQKIKYVYFAEVAIQNRKLAFKLWNWLWFKKLIILLYASRIQE